MERAPRPNGGNGMRGLQRDTRSAAETGCQATDHFSANLPNDLPRIISSARKATRWTHDQDNCSPRPMRLSHRRGVREGPHGRGESTYLGTNENEDAIYPHIGDAAKASAEGKSELPTLASKTKKILKSTTYLYELKKKNKYQR